MVSNIILNKGFLLRIFVNLISFNFVFFFLNKFKRNIKFKWKFCGIRENENLKGKKENKFELLGNLKW